MVIKSLFFPPLNQAPNTDFINAVEVGTKIPKIIHQTYFSDNFPEKIRASVENTKRLNPDWEYRFYDDDAILFFIENNYCRNVLELFKKIDSRYGAAKADVFRYLLMYKVGGVYLDIKSEVRYPLSSVLREEDRFLLSVWEDKFGNCKGWGDHYEIRHIQAGEFQQWHIVCAPGHPFMKAVLENVFFNLKKYIPSIHGVGKPGTLRLTGPIAYTMAIDPIQNKYPHRVVDSRYDLGFEYNTYDGKSHEAILKSHYSKQTASIVELGFRKKLISAMLAIPQVIFDTFKSIR